MNEQREPGRQKADARPQPKASPVGVTTPDLLERISTGIEGLDLSLIHISLSRPSQRPKLRALFLRRRRRLIGSLLTAHARVALLLPLRKLGLLIVIQQGIDLGVGLVADAFHLLPIRRRA